MNQASPYLASKFIMNLLLILRAPIQCKLSIIDDNSYQTAYLDNRRPNEHDSSLINSPEQPLSIKLFKRTYYFESLGSEPSMTDGNVSVIDHPYLTSSTCTKCHLNYRPDWTGVSVISCRSNPTTPHMKETKFNYL